MHSPLRGSPLCLVLGCSLSIAVCPAHAAPPSGAFEAALRAKSAAKPAIMKRARDLLTARYDLSGRTDPVARMSGGKPIPVGPTARLAPGLTWESLAALGAEEIKRRGVFPYPPLPHPLAPTDGGMVFPASQTRTHPELVRFDVDFDLPDAYLPEFPPPMYLTTRPDLGDVSHGEEVTLDNADALLRDVLTPFQLDGLRLLLTPFPQQQFNATEDRAALRAATAVTCFSCHVNGHTTGQFHLTPDLRPQAARFRIETPSLRGLFAQRTFGSKRNLRSPEEFTEVENNTAYFDGDIVTAAAKGARHFTRTEVGAMAAVQNILDLPPAPKLFPSGELNHRRATESELRGQTLFRGKAQCAGCHPAPYFTDNLSHDLGVEQLYQGRAEGIFKTPVLRGVKDSPPYLHDGRCPTLEDTVELFNLLLDTRLTAEQKKDLVAYLRTL